MKGKKKTNCGDWHRGWGYSGHDKIGKLTKLDNGVSFSWNGYSQGRHGAKWNKGAFCCVDVVDGELIFTNQKGSIPVRSEIIKSIKELNPNIKINK
jgi:hypothetical protein